MVSIELYRHPDTGKTTYIASLTKPPIHWQIQYEEEGFQLIHSFVADKAWSGIEDGTLHWESAGITGIFHTNNEEELHHELY